VLTTQVNADSENKRNEARRHYREVLERTPEKYKQFMPPPVPEKTLSDHLNERVCCHGGLQDQADVVV
jgi:hypothetical protein